VRLIAYGSEAREEAKVGRIAVGYREPGYVRTAVHEYVHQVSDVPRVGHSERARCLGVGRRNMP
jgi:hypothetical protein